MRPDAARYLSTFYFIRNPRELSLNPAIDRQPPVSLIAHWFTAIIFHYLLILVLCIPLRAILLVYPYAFYHSYILPISISLQIYILPISLRTIYPYKLHPFYPYGPYHSYILISLLLILIDYILPTSSQTLSLHNISLLCFSDPILPKYPYKPYPSKSYVSFQCILTYRILPIYSCRPVYNFMQCVSKR